MRIELEKTRHALIVRLAGELDHHTASDLRTRVDEELDKEINRNIVLDLEQLSFMDSSGIGVILGRYRRIKKVGGKMALCSALPQVKKVLDIAGLGKIIPLFGSEKQAIRYIGG